MTQSQKLNPRPFVKWVGGKRSLLPKIFKRLPPKIERYFEPFAGGGALYFSLFNRITHATLVDNNLELVLAYNAIKRDPHTLIKKLKDHAGRHSKKYYYSVRIAEPKDPIEKAARFLYLNKTCFNGLYRVNKSGKFNSPMGKYKNPNIIQEKNILDCHQALQNADILFGDFTTINTLVQPGDFIYFDPPYHPTTDVSFTEYTKENFTEKDQARLRDFIIDMHRKGISTMLSNSKTKFIEDLYDHQYFQHYVVLAPRFVNCKPLERDKVKELLITNYSDASKEITEPIINYSYDRGNASRYVRQPNRLVA